MNFYNTLFYQSETTDLILYSLAIIDGLLFLLFFIFHFRLLYSKSLREFDNRMNKLFKRVLWIFFIYIIPSIVYTVFTSGGATESTFIIFMITHGGTVITVLYVLFMYYFINKYEP